MLALAVLVGYEALKHFGVAQAASGSSGPATSPDLSTGNAASAGSLGQYGYVAGPPPSGANIVSPSTVASGLAQRGVSQDAIQQFVNTIIPRESSFNLNATCWAPGSNSGACTPYQKPGDTQVAQGLFQFLSTTWRGYGCQGSPYNLNDALDCAAAAWRRSGLTAWTPQ